MWNKKELVRDMDGLRTTAEHIPEDTAVDVRVPGSSVLVSEVFSSRPAAETSRKNEPAAPTTIREEAREVIRAARADWSQGETYVEAALDAEHARQRRDRALVLSVYDSERRYLHIKADDHQRARYIEAKRDRFLRLAEFEDRDTALAAHEAAKDQLFALDAPSTRALKADEVLALALVARQREDEFQAARRQQRAQSKKATG